jgi:alkylhydroperoxidase family enzyme
MRINLPEGQQDPFSTMGNYFAPAIVGAGNAFSQAVYTNSSLPLRVFEGARARTAEINGCAVCRAFRAKRDLPKRFESQGIDAATTVFNNGEAPDEDFYQNITNWKTWSGYSERERIGIEYAERFCLDPQGLAVDESFWARAKSEFSDEEIVDLNHCIAAFISSGRIAHVLGLDSVCAITAD